MSAEKIALELAKNGIDPSLADDTIKNMLCVEFSIRLVRENKLGAEVVNCMQSILKNLENRGSEMLIDLPALYLATIAVRRAFDEWLAKQADMKAEEVRNDPMVV